MTGTHDEAGEGHVVVFADGETWDDVRRLEVEPQSVTLFTATRDDVISGRVRLRYADDGYETFNLGYAVYAVTHTGDMKARGIAPDELDAMTIDGEPVATLFGRTT